MSIEVQRWFSLRCIVPKIFTINLEQDFAGFKYKTPRNQALYLNVNIFGTIQDRFVNMQNAALLYCTIKKIQRFEDRVIWRVYGRFSRTITRDYAVFFTWAHQQPIKKQPNLLKCTTLRIPIFTHSHPFIHPTTWLLQVTEGA